MGKKEYVYLGMPIKMKKLLDGFAPEIFNPDSKTSFTWTEHFFGKNDGQISWIIKRLPEWAKIVNERSGVLVTSYKHKVTRSLASGRLKDWEITFNLKIAGALNLKKVHPVIRNNFSGFFKKLLGEELFCRFPLSPYLYTEGKYTPFCAGTEDMYVLRPSIGGTEDAVKKATELLFTGEFKLWLEEFLKQKFAKLISMKSVGTSEKSSDFWFCTIIIIKWDNDVNYEKRSELAEEIKKKMQELKITRVFSGSEHLFFHVEFR